MTMTENINSQSWKNVSCKIVVEGPRDDVHKATLGIVRSGKGEIPIEATAMADLLGRLLESEILNNRNGDA
mgnify:CR=1 FL=1